MTADDNVSYVFGGFSLFPKGRTLHHLQAPVDLPGKYFDILCYLVQHANTLIKSSDLAEAIWGSEGKIYARNLPHHIARIRKVIGCDARAPKFIKTIHWQKAYRFIGSVSVEYPNLREKETPVSTGATLDIECHLFVPTFVGEDFFRVLRVKEELKEFTSFKRYPMERAVLSVMSVGFGVWHITESKEFEHLWEFAQWRQRYYRQILQGKHAITRYTREIFKAQGNGPGLIRSIRKSSYVFSVQILRSRVSRDQQALNRFVRLMATPSSLESHGNPAKPSQGIESIERKLLESDSASKDLEEFGLPNRDIGYASWDGVSYFHTSGEDLGKSIEEFEMAVQVLWWTCKCSCEIFLAGDASETERVRRYIPELRRLFAKIKNIGATEPPSRRTMREAIIKTSRLKEMFEEMIDLASVLGK